MADNEVLTVAGSAWQYEFPVSIDLILVGNCTVSRILSMRVPVFCHAACPVIVLTAARMNNLNASEAEIST